MIKGINKQIIEVKCTNSEYFDKILLFVKGQKSVFSPEILHNQAIGYCNALTVNSQRKKPIRRKLYIFLRIAILSVMGFGGGVAFAAALIK